MKTGHWIIAIQSYGLTNANISYIFGTKRRVCVRVMVWRCFPGETTGSLVKIIPCGSRLIGEPFTFQQGNDPKHTAGICKLLNEKQQEMN